jgi:hypothetical protein
MSLAARSKRLLDCSMAAFAGLAEIKRAYPRFAIPTL